MKAVSQALINLANEIDKNESLPTFAPDDVNLEVAREILRQHFETFDITMEVSQKTGKQPQVAWSVGVYTKTYKYTPEKTFNGSTLTKAANQAIAWKEAGAGIEGDEAADQVSKAQEAIACLAPVKDPIDEAISAAVHQSSPQTDF